MKLGTKTAMLWMFAALGCLGDTAENIALAQTPGKGDAAPEFRLPIIGKSGFLSLKEANESGPVVVVVLRGYPGYQCPLCSDQVSTFANRAEALASLTDHVILVYPGAASLLEKHAEEFMGDRSLPEPLTMVRDPDMKMINEYALRWNSPRETAYPATFVVDGNGEVRWSKVSDSHGGRASAQEVIDALRALKKK